MASASSSTDAPDALPVPHPSIVDIVDEPDKSLRIGGIFVPPPPIPALTYDPREPRLVISDLTIKNFKSYAGEQKLGPFNKNFTCIVGPNGSGKSNVIDALLFVFGYRAQKIRSKKISILIHKSEKFPNVNSCTVTVHFAMLKDEGDKFEIVPNSRFTVSRTGYKDNSSSYDINGKRAQYKEVNTLLQKYGIDLEYSRFLILQGEIELIAMMKSKGQNEGDTGMLEYMEDIIGSNRYIEPIQHFDKKVEELNEVKNEKTNQLAIIQKEMQDIEGPKNNAVEYLKLENKIIQIENRLLQVKLQGADDELQRTIMLRDEMVEGMKTCVSQQEEMHLKKKLKEAELEKLNNTHEDFVEIVDKLKGEYNKLEQEDATCRENLNYVKEKIKKITKSLDAEEQTLKTLKKQPVVLKSEAGELTAKLKNLETRKAAEDDNLTEVMKTLKLETEEMQEHKDQLESKLMDLKTTLFQAKKEMDISESELSLCLSNEKREKEKLIAIENEHEKVDNIIKEKAAILKEAEHSAPIAEAKLKVAKQQLVDTEEGENKLSEELRAKRMKVEELKSSFNAIKHQNAMMQAFHEEKQKGRLTGIHGRLGDLGSIDDKYDVAISTACASLDNIVTDTLATAQQCVDFLKANDLGYATFIALDKMTHWEPYTRQRISTPENVPRLFDLISVPNKDVLPAFYYALRDTLVANDLEQATRIGLQGATRHRIVTLKGDLIDLSGTMSGGGGKALKGRMGKNVVMACDVSPQELDAMVAEVENLKKNVAELRKNKICLEDDIENLTKEIRSLQHAINKSKLEFNAYSENKKLIIAKIAQQKKTIIEEAPDEKEVKQLEKKIKEKKKNYEVALEASDAVEVKVKSLQDKIMSITKGKFNSAQKKGEKITKEMDDVRQAMTKTKVLIKSAERKVSKCEEKVTSLKENLDQLKKNKDALRAEFDLVAEKATVIVERRNEALKNVEECEEKKAAFIKKIQALREEEHQLKSDLIEHKNNIKRAENCIKDREATIKSLNVKLSKLKLHDVEDLGDNPLPTFTKDERYTTAVDALAHEMGTIQAQMDNMNPDLNAIYEYKRKEDLFKMKKRDVEDTVRLRDLQKYYYEELRKRRLGEFMRGFTLIATKLKEMYQMLTIGGDAELELVDSLDPFSEGISFSVRPPKKSWKAISNLSGGEKTLSSLSLVFALHYYRSTSFYVMDEIDAALDFRNVAIVGCYVKLMTKNAQFIIISLRNSMFELSDNLIGIFKTDNCTGQIPLMGISGISKLPAPAARNDDGGNSSNNATDDGGGVSRVCDRDNDETVSNPHDSDSDEIDDESTSGKI